MNLGRHGLTVIGMAVQICQRSGHGEDAKTVPPDFHFEKGDGPDLVVMACSEDSSLPLH